LITTVVNLKNSSYDFLICRGTIFGNPYEIGIDGTRKEVIERYKVWFNFMLRDQIFKDAVMKLKGKRLGCYCSPLKCHGDVICNYLNSVVDLNPNLSIFVDNETKN